LCYLCEVELLPDDAKITIILQPTGGGRGAKGEREREIKS